MKFLVFIFIAGLCHSPVFAATSIRVIEERMAAEILGTFKKNVEEEAALVPLWMAEAIQNGSWTDLDYETQSGVSWGPTLHLGRARLLAAFHETPGQLYYHDPQLLIAIKKSIDYFIQKNFTSYNWWFNEVGVPINAGQTLIMMREALKTERIGYSKFFMNREMTFRRTGQNFAWLAQIWLYRGVIENNPTPIKDAVEAIEGQLVLKERLGYDLDEGLFPDLSFIQHHWVFYNLGYGLYFSDTLSQFVQYLLDTPYQLSKPHLDQLVSYVALGQLSMIRNGTLDYSGTGRNHVRLNAEDASLMGKVCERLAGVASPYQALFAKCASGIAKKDFKQSLNRLFWNGDYMVHQRPEFMISVKMHSTRVVNADQPSNGEGMRSTHQSDGATYIFKTGLEYKDIFPLWDYRRVPGTTALPLAWPAVYYHGNFDYRDVFNWSSNPHDFVGGVSDGDFGLATMILTKFGIHEKKTYFFNDQGMVVLGTELQCDPPCSGLSSAVNQEWLNGVVTIGSDEETYVLPEESSVAKKISWVHHGNTAYLFPEKTQVYVAAQEQSGDISKISAQVPSHIFRGEVFSLSIPREDVAAKSYAYAVQPGVSVQMAADRSHNPGFEILANSPEIQALRSGSDLLQVSFFKPSTLSLKKGWLQEIKTDKAIALQLRGSEKNFELIVSDPSHLLPSATINLTSTSGQTISTTVRFPLKGNAGKPIKTTLTSI